MGSSRGDGAKEGIDILEKITQNAARRQGNENHEKEPETKSRECKCLI